MVQRSPWQPGLLTLPTVRPTRGGGPTASSEHTVPATLVRQVATLAQRWQIPQAELLAPLGLSDVPADPLSRVPLETMVGLLERARLLTGEAGLGYYLALQERASTYGYIGLAASAAPTLRGAIDLAVKYAPLFSTALSIGLRVDGHRAFLYLEENADLGGARDIVLIHLMLGLETLAHALTGRHGHAAAEIAIPEPAYHARFAHLVPRWRFGQRTTFVVIDAQALDRPVSTADPVSLELLRATCERSLAELGFDWSFLAQVRGLLSPEPGAFRSLGEVAKELRLSRRTLIRRLAARGVSFSGLTEQLRREQALVLLRSSSLSVEVIAQRLDYLSASSFVRAFRGWTGTTPAVYRRESGRPSPPSLSSAAGTPGCRVA